MADFQLHGVKDKTQRQLMRKCADQGWKMTLTGSSHVRMLPPNGGSIIIASLSTGDRRSVLALRCQLRRAGADV